MLGLGALPGLGGMGAGGCSPGSGADADDAMDGNNLDIPAGCNMGRRRSRAVLYQLSGHYKPEKAKPKLKLGNVSRAEWRRHLLKAIKGFDGYAFYLILVRFALFYFLHFLQNLLHSTEAPFPEYKTQSIKKSRFILPHYGVFKGIWDWIILVSTFYVAILVPYNAAFAKADRATMVSDVIVEALFIVGK